MRTATQTAILADDVNGVRIVHEGGTVFQVDVDGNLTAEGSLEAAGGVVLVDDNGITVEAESAYNLGQNAIKFKGSSETLAALEAIEGSSTHYAVRLSVFEPSSDGSAFLELDYDLTGDGAKAVLEAFNLILLTSSLVKVDGVLGVKAASSTPSAVAGFIQIYGDTADGDLKAVFPNGTVRTLATN